ncbi:MAG: acetylornithine carbamoyltransferase [Chitinophagaceae bacterium]|nr:acetylornithine carbamoyltransferase [Chitinophagaceae bacterium]
MRHFLSAADAGNIDELAEEALRIKANPLANRQYAGKRLGLMFMNPSLRTRISSQVAALNLGLEPIVLNTSGDSWQLEFADGVMMDGNKAEHIKDAAPVLGSYFDILGVRTFPSLRDKEDDYSEHVLNAFVKYSGIPVISLESATRHPLQSLADIITIKEQMALQEIKRPKVVLMWAPHIKPLPQCVANSFSEWMNAWRIADFVISHPEGYELDSTFTGNTTIEYNREKALKDADFIYVKNWSSVRDYGKILPVKERWMLTQEDFRNNPHAKVMHCLPVRRNLVLSDEILDSEHSLVTQQAANRVWSAQTVLSEILRGNF